MKTKIFRLLVIVFVVLVSTSTQSNAQDQKEIVDLSFEKMPEYPGGDIALKNDLDSLINFHKGTIKKNITGSVYVRFTVDQDGLLKNSEIYRGIDEDLNKEALRVIGSLKSWKPGMESDEPIVVNYIVRFDFMPNKKVECQCVNFASAEY